ncbi:MAG: carboxypeptidase regulatory-like domain-containing protein [Pyrinomonadaceae bacterium]
MTPDGTRLLAVNSPNGTLSIFQLTGGGQPRLTAEIPVGLEPVSVAVRNNSEAWVANWLSDSVSIVDLSSGNVIRTLDVGDEPTDVLFGGSTREMVFVCVSGGASLLNGTPVDKLGRGLIKVFDPSNLSSFQTIELSAKQPRALAKNADGSRVFVSIFESGSQTTIVREADVTANGGLPPPNPTPLPGLPTAPRTGLIVKWDGTNWRDEINRSWNSFIPYSLADIDLAVIDASGAGLPSNVSSQVSGIGTHVGNMGFDPALNRLMIANLDDINQVRFEPNIRGRFQQNRVSLVSTAGSGTAVLLGPVDLNQHADFGSPAGTDDERSLSLALPSDIVRQSDGTFYVAATSSARVGVLSSAGSVTGRIAVGQGPTGLALDEARQRLYVLNRFDHSIGIVDTTSKTQVAQVTLGFNPEPQSVRDGRRFLYDASLSAHGTVSCASCHLNGHRDGMVWDLGNPQGQIAQVMVFLPPGITATDNLHPMKGPMMTQSLRGIIGNEPLHWRGDRTGLESFNAAFMSLLGGPRELTTAEMSAFKTFVQSLAYPPNPNESSSRPPNEFQPGFSFFSNNRLDGGVINCSECHLITNFKPGTDNRITPSLALQEPQSVKVPQLRGLYQKMGINRTQASPQITGFGLIHDGTFDTLFNFMKAPQFDFSSAGSEATADGWRRDIEQMLLKLDTGTAPAVGLQVTANAGNKNSFEVANRINVLVDQSNPGAAQNCDLIVRGIYGHAPRGFLHIGGGLFQPDSIEEAPVTVASLLAAVKQGAELTFTGVPIGEGRQLALDHDGNGILNDDEPRTSVQLSGRVVDGTGNGVTGVTITLSGSQTAATSTDGDGNFALNFISTVGTHTLTPTKSGLNFGPTSRTFVNPVWNQSVLFITPSGVTTNVIDAISFFVRQHYEDFLNRDPDGAGLGFWQNEIDQCGTNAQCVELKRINVSGAFYLSIEFQETGYLVYRTTMASFGSMPRFAQFFPDTQRIGRGVVVGQTGWETLLETNKRAFFEGWVQLPNFIAAFPNSMTANEFVDKLALNAGHVLSSTERQQLVAVLATTPDDTTKRASVLRSVAEDADFHAKEFNRAFVLMQYFGYLRRNPDDPPDNNLDGLNFWLNKLNQFGGNFINAEMVKAFLVSTEYRQRFGP